MFQDIMTAVTGILILIVILQIIQVNDSPANAKPSPQATSSQQQQLKNILEELNNVEFQNATLRKTLQNDNQRESTETSSISTSEMEGDVVRYKQKLNEIQGDLAKQKEKEREADKLVGLGDDEQKLTSSEEDLTASKEEISSIERKEQDLKSNVTALEEKVKAAQESQKRLYIIPDEANTSKEPIVVMVSKTGLQFSRFNHPGQTVDVAEGSNDDSINLALKKFSSQDQWMVFYIKPSGVALFKRANKLAQDQGFEVGSDAIEEDQQIVVSQPSSDNSNQSLATPEPAANSSVEQTDSVVSPAPGVASQTTIGGSAGSNPIAQPPQTNAPSIPTAATSSSQDSNQTNNSGAQQSASTMSQDIPQPNASSSPKLSTDTTTSADKVSVSTPNSSLWLLLTIAIIIIVIMALLFMRNK